MPTEPNSQRPVSATEHDSALVRADQAGKRLDQVAADLFPEYSRSRLQRCIDDGQLLVDDQTAERRQKVQAGMVISLRVELVDEGEWIAQDISVDILYEDKYLLVLNKPVGLVVHPAAGNRDGTLLNALLYRYPDLREIPRAGIVHRLDKDTSGLMVVARTLPAQTALVKQLQARSVKRQYEAVVAGGPVTAGKVDAPIGRSGTNRLKMAVLASGKPAVTHYRVIRRFEGFSHMQLNLETGRTHQIRVHMTHMHWPLVGDPLYGGKPRLPKGCSLELRSAIENFSRQALHAVQLALIHPHSGAEMSWQSSFPDDMQFLLDRLADEGSPGD